MLARNVACINCLTLYDANEVGQCPKCGAVGQCNVNQVPEDDCKMPEEQQGWEMGKGYEDTPGPKLDIFDPVKFVKHYQVFPEHDVEARHIIERCIQLSGLKGGKAYLYGNALKYLLRLNRKGSMEEDASKAQEYLGYMKE